MEDGFVGIGENAGAFHDDVDSKLAPRQGLWVAFCQGAKNIAADAAKTGNGDFNCYFVEDL